jgi:hypothetical protein
MIKNSKGRRRGFSCKDVGTSSPNVKLTGDFDNAIASIRIGDIHRQTMCRRAYPRADFPDRPLATGRNYLQPQQNNLLGLGKYLQI